MLLGHTLLESLSSRHSWGHKPRPEITRASEYTARVFTPVSQVAEARTPLLKFKIEREILVLEISRFGKN